MAGRFVLKKSGDQFHFNLKSGNHEVILTSERYTAKASALGGIEAVRMSSSSAREAGVAAVKATAPAATVDDQTSPGR